MIEIGNLSSFYTLKHIFIAYKQNSVFSVYNLQFTVCFITSAKEVMFLPGFVCGFVSFFVNKITQKLMDGF